MASIKANEIREQINICAFKEGLRAIPATKAPKSVPSPAPGPIRLIVAKPAPMNLEPANNGNACVPGTSTE